MVMPRGAFIPARSSRHRAAALALYKSLLRSAIELESLQAFNCRQSLRDLVRRRFEDAASYTSLRLVYAAFVAGYKYLDILKRSLEPTSSEHSHLLRVLGSRRRSSNASLSESPQRSVAALGLVKPIQVESLIYNIAPPEQPPKYISTKFPRSSTEVGRQRKVPSLCATAHGQPFIRVYKPQARTLSRMIGRKERILERKIGNMVVIDEETTPMAALEDQWEELVETQARQEGRPMRREPGAPQDSYVFSVLLGRLWLKWQVDSTWQDWVARGEALHDIVQAEERLAAQEGVNLGMQSDSVSRASGKDTALRSRANVSVMSSRHSALVNLRPDSDKTLQDPFLSESWEKLVREQNSMLLKFTELSQRNT